MIGQRFGKWTVIDDGYRDSQKRAVVICRCDCGKEKPVRLDSLKVGQSLMCRSCSQSKIMVGSKRAYKHGATINRKTERTYRIWSNMLDRVRRSSHKYFKDYGGRGIEVCTSWYNYREFKEWALKNGYADNLQIDRTNNDGNYEPSNCRWVTSKANNRNRRDIGIINGFGISKKLCEWAEDPRCEVHKHTLWRRLKQGITLERAMEA